MKDKIEQLDQLEQDGIIEKVQYADWAAPIVPVLKADGKSLRICGDFKVTVNRASKIDRYPIPKSKSTFAHGRMFTKLDMSRAYQQIQLEEESNSQRTIPLYIYSVWHQHQEYFSELWSAF